MGRPLFQAMQRAEYAYMLHEHEREEQEYTAYLRRMRERRDVIKRRLKEREAQRELFGAMAQEAGA